MAETLTSAEVLIPADDVELHGDLRVPEDARGIVVFAHGSGSGRHSPRNRFVADRLVEAGLATLLLDLLTAREEREDSLTAHLRFDIGLLAERLRAAIEWTRADDRVLRVPVGLFGASTGAAAALIAATAGPGVVGAVVSRGGRPDLAGSALAHVASPTLLIVGGRDDVVIKLNEAALSRLTCKKRLVIIPGATHLFEEPGALERVAEQARQWFVEHLPSTRHSSS
jgi:dienelactone hydrolase